MARRANFVCPKRGTWSACLETISALRTTSIELVCGDLDRVVYRLREAGAPPAWGAPPALDMDGSTLHRWCRGECEPGPWRRCAIYLLAVEYLNAALRGDPALGRRLERLDRRRCAGWARRSRSARGLALHRLGLAAPQPMLAAPLVDYGRQVVPLRLPPRLLDRVRARLGLLAGKPRLGRSATVRCALRSWDALAGACLDAAPRVDQPTTRVAISLYGPDLALLQDGAVWKRTRRGWRRDRGAHVVEAVALLEHAVLDGDAELLEPEALEPLRAFVVAALNGRIIPAAVPFPWIGADATGTAEHAAARRRA